MPVAPVAERGAVPNSRWRLVLALTLATFVVATLPAHATHVQTTQTGAPMQAQFDHDGDNAWWVEFLVRPVQGQVNSGHVQVEGSSTLHAMKVVATFSGWQKFAPQQAFNVPTGKRVMFWAGMTDGSNLDTVTSCWFTHPGGFEQCDGSGTSSSSSTTGSSSSTTSTWASFDATFTGVRGNEWWVQANVATNGPGIGYVGVRTLTRCGDAYCASEFQPLAQQGWGPNAWAASYRLPQGSLVQLIAASNDGRTDLSGCRQWVPASNTDAQVVPCPSASPQRFDASFTGVKGNEWWVQVNAAGNEPIGGVVARIGCDTGLHPLTKQSWGGWAASIRVPAGTKVDFRASSSDGDVDWSGAYLWPSASPTTACGSA